MRGAIWKDRGLPAARFRLRPYSALSRLCRLRCQSILAVRLVTVKAYQFTLHAGLAPSGTPGLATGAVLLRGSRGVTTTNTCRVSKREMYIALPESAAQQATALTPRRGPGADGGELC
eukprot:scaffold79102_cov64-Phaeocystis_antarctica.AAC.5